MQPPSKDSKAEVTTLKEELQLVLKKEREAQVCVHTLAPVTTMLLLFFSPSSCLCAPQKELAALRASLATQVESTDGSDIQVGICLILSLPFVYCFELFNMFSGLSLLVCAGAARVRVQQAE